MTDEVNRQVAEAEAEAETEAEVRPETEAKPETEAEPSASPLQQDAAETLYRDPAEAVRSRARGVSRGKVFALVCIAFAAGIVLSLVGMSLLTGSRGDSAGGVIEQKKINEMNSYINRYYLRNYDAQKLVDNAYRGYVAGLEDPYSQYMTAEEYASYETSAMGTYSGVGVTFETKEDGSYVIVGITKDSPAERAGLKAGDQILAVDGEIYTSSDVMASHIRGKRGTKVELTYLRGDEEKTVTTVREKIVQDSVDYRMLDDTTGYIQITQFIESTSADFDEALKAVEAKGAKKLVLDLRDNGGGLVDDAVAVADDFLDKGVACYVQDRNGETESYKVKDGHTDLKTVVLVNENSASASEILAAAMKDNDYTIVGSRTFGKGIIQTSFVMRDGDALKLTILEYLSPKKHKVHEKGVRPNVKVKDDENTKRDEQLERARQVLEEQ